MEKYYSTDISITINEITASTQQEADALIAEFIAKIAPIMSDKIRWDEADWHVETNVLDEAQGVWKTLGEEVSE